MADRDSHTLYSLDADSGAEVWHYIAGGRIDSSPTLYRGTIIFGSADGWVNCLDSASGKVAWRFHAAPHQRMIVDRNHVESVWRVHGSVLVDNDTAYVVAGRSSFLDSGLYLWALDPVTGEVQHQARLDTLTATRHGRPGQTVHHTLSYRGYQLRTSS